MLARAREQLSQAVDVAQRTAAARRGRRPRRGAPNDAHNHPDGGDNADDEASVKSGITIETRRTVDNENRKSLAGSGGRLPTEIYCEKSDDPGQDPTEILTLARSDITKTSIYLQRIGINRSVSSAFTSLVRGDDRSWEAIAADLLRKSGARWTSITLDDCEGEYLDSMLAFLLHVDATEYLHLSNLILTSHAAWSLQSLQFCKTMTKLQLDLVDLSFIMPLLCKGLRHNTSMRSLITSRCGLNDDRLHELFTNLPPRLEELRIFGNKCREKGLVAITAIVHHSQHLKILDMSYQHVNPNDTKDGEFDVSWLAGALHSNKVLRVLDLDNCGVDDGHMTHLCAALCHNTTLEELMLNHNRITSTGIALLTVKFNEMKGLKKISMYSNLFDASSKQVDDMVAAQHQNRHPLPSRIIEEAKPSQANKGSDDEASNGPMVGGFHESTTSELDVDLGEDDEDGEEIIVEDSGDEDENDVDEEGSYMSDNSSTPPPSADFRLPDEIATDSIDEGNNGDDDDAFSSGAPELTDSKEAGAAEDDEYHEETIPKIFSSVALPHVALKEGVPEPPPSVNGTAAPTSLFVT